MRLLKTGKHIANAADDSAKEIMKMGLLEDMNRRVKKFNLVDVKLAQVTAMFGALIIAKLIPDIMNLSVWWFAAMLIVCAIRPSYVFWLVK
jgi:hypothetical protein